MVTCECYKYLSEYVQCTVNMCRKVLDTLRSSFQRILDNLYSTVDMSTYKGPIPLHNRRFKLENSTQRILSAVVLRTTYKRFSSHWLSNSTFILFSHNCHLKCHKPCGKNVFISLITLVKFRKNKPGCFVDICYRKLTVVYWCTCKYFLFSVIWKRVVKIRQPIKSDHKTV